MLDLHIYSFHHFMLILLLLESLLWCIKPSMPLMLLKPSVTSEKMHGWQHFMKRSRYMLVNISHPSKIRKRSARKRLGERCSTFNECPSISLCMGGVCSCPYDYYKYVPHSEPEMAMCRKKTKYGYVCTFVEDCQGYDSNSACVDGICKCINGTHFIGSRNVAHDRRCYKILEREGDQCEIDEQCSRLTDNYRKCRCIGRCDCASVDVYGGCSICHENIKRTFFGGVAFIIILLTSRLFSRMRQHSRSRQQQQQQQRSALDLGSGNTRDRRGRINSSCTVPSVSFNRGNLQHNRHLTASLPDVFLIETHSLIGLPLSHTTQFHPQGNRFITENVSERNEDAPPSYEDIVDSDQMVWNEPPPAYEEVALKDDQSERQQI